MWPECLAVKEAGFDVVVACPQGTHRDRARFEISDGIEIHRFPIPFAAGVVVSYVREYTAALREIRRLVRRLSPASSFALVQRDLVPELFVSRFGPRRRLLLWSTRMVEPLSFHLADVVISPNESYRRVAIERGAKRPGDVFVVRNAPDTTLSCPRPPDVSLKHGKRHLLAYVGTMNRQDGLDHAIEALAVLRRKRSDWHVFFVGDGDASADARRLSEDVGLQDLVDFTGFLPAADVVRVLTTADLCLGVFATAQASRLISRLIRRGPSCFV